MALDLLPRAIETMAFDSSRHVALSHVDVLERI
jgi:hypothetical protein